MLPDPFKSKKKCIRIKSTAVRDSNGRIYIRKYNSPYSEIIIYNNWFNEFLFAKIEKGFLTYNNRFIKRGFRAYFIAKESGQLKCDNNFMNVLFISNVLWDQENEGVKQC